MLKKGLHEKSNMSDVMIRNKKCDFSINRKAGITGVSKQRDPETMRLNASGDTNLSNFVSDDEFDFIDEQERDTHKKFRNLSCGHVGCHHGIKMPFAGRKDKTPAGLKRVNCGCKKL